MSLPTADEEVEDVLGAEGLVDADFHFLTQSLYSVENMAGLGRSQSTLR